MRDPLVLPHSDDYQRPQQPWQCGLADEGPPCPMGPDAGGHCPQAAACRPVRDGDRWRCNRSTLRGGPCAEGPGPDGACAIVFRCTPVRSLRARRGRIIGAATVGAIGAVVMILSGSWRDAWIAPGPLARVHAQLIAGSERIENQGRLGCAACHAAGGASLGEWFGHVTGQVELGATQSSLCMECHAKMIAKAGATSAHSWLAGGAGAGAARLAGGDPRRDPHEGIACSACHREHQGLEHSLTAMSDAACQACHQQVYHSFAVDHPDFGDWPYAEPTRIAFSHASHAGKHFVEAKREFACAACHQPDATGDVQTTLPYAQACGECHDKALAVSLADGVSLVALPTLDGEALADAGARVAPWPDAATGDFEGTIPGPMQLLLAADVEVAAALETLGQRFDFFDLDVADREQLEAATRVLASMQRLTAELADRGQAAVGERLERVLDRPLTTAELAALVGGLSPDAARGYRDAYFPAPGGGAAPPSSLDRAAAAALIPTGGWMRDDVTLSLRYRPGGHDDPWLRAWLDAYAEAAGGRLARIAEPLLNDALKPTAPGQCGSCHTLRKDPGGRVTIAWRAADATHARAPLTRFSHAPHLTDAKLRDCTMCHAVGSPPKPLINSGSDIVSSKPADFAPLSKSLCAECHVAKLAGESCTQCHAYHSRDGIAAADALNPEP